MTVARMAGIAVVLTAYFSSVLAFERSVFMAASMRSATSS